MNMWAHYATRAQEVYMGYSFKGCDDKDKSTSFVWANMAEERRHDLALSWP